MPLFILPLAVVAAQIQPGATASTAIYGVMPPVCTVEAPTPSAIVSLATRGAQSITRGRSTAVTASTDSPAQISSLNGGALVRGDQRIDYRIAQDGETAIAVADSALSAPIISNITGSGSVVAGTSGMLTVTVPNLPERLLAGDYTDYHHDRDHAELGARFPRGSRVKSPLKRLVAALVIASLGAAPRSRCGCSRWRADLKTSGVRHLAGSSGREQQRQADAGRAPCRASPDPARRQREAHAGRGRFPRFSATGYRAAEQLPDLSRPVCRQSGAGPRRCCTSCTVVQLPIDTDRREDRPACSSCSTWERLPRSRPMAPSPISA